jgi:hypothetical protein
MEEQSTWGTLPYRSPKPKIEWALPSAGEPLRQCDILQIVDFQPGSPRELSLVVTADCDLAQSKHHGQILVLPIFEIDQYLIKYRLPMRPHVKQVQKDIESLLVGSVNQALEQVGKAKMDGAETLDWCNTHGARSVFNLINGYFPPDQKHFEELRTIGEESFQILQKFENADNLVEFNRILDDSSRLLKRSGQKSQSAETVIAEAVRTFLSSTPKDAYVLAEISPIHKVGYVVGLRFPYTIPLEQISFLNIDEDASRQDLEARYRRISSIIPPYSYSIASQFGALFTAVGLPDEQRESIKIMGEIRIETFSEKAKLS